MNDEIQDKLDKIYDDLKQTRDEIALKINLGGMELRDQWKELDADWDRWTDEVAKDLNATAEDLERKLREAGGEDLRKIEIKTKLAVGKLKQGFQEVVDRLSGD